MARLDIHPLTADRFDDFARLFGPQGACYGCWCTYFRMAPKDRKASNAAANKAFMRARIEAGPAPGLLGYLGGEPVAWLQVGPRADTPEWNNARRVSAPVDDTEKEDARNWAVTCFFTRSRERGQGLSHEMVAAAIRFARVSGAMRLEACPMRAAKQAKSVGLFVGSHSVFEAAGFRTIVERKDGRPLMRLELQS
ncbi:MAG TPA: GNAT family N-acetyltransferase [Rhizobiaceae bacterium]|nr:GNAT family N-acetyltransferase [Rhizobiaceae bacterium]